MDELTNEQRADLARWVVAMRRAHIAGTPQSEGHLHDATGWCCLGLWCAVAEAAGLVKRTAGPWLTTMWSSPAGTGDDNNYLHESAKLAGATNPMVLEMPDGMSVRDELSGLMSASWANDSAHLTFEQIADCVTWNYAITADELEAAEAMPRVPEIEQVQP